MSSSRNVNMASADAMENLGATIAGASEDLDGVRIYLHGELGTGKTTLVRGFLRAAGHVGSVRSPTYTLIEPYSLPRGEVFHLDLYRLSAAEELEFLGLRDLEQPGCSLLVEWPQRGEGALPSADLELFLHYSNSARAVELVAHSPKGAELLRALDETLPAHS